MKKPQKISELYRRIYQVAAQIPFGKVATYGQIARLAGLPGHARLVGYALHNLPADMDVPWQRVINAQGRISLPKDSGAYDIQRALLEQEQIVFERERIDLSKYQWKPDQSVRSNVKYS